MREKPSLYFEFTDTAVGQCRLDSVWRNNAVVVTECKREDMLTGTTAKTKRFVLIRSAVTETLLLLLFSEQMRSSFITDHRHGSKLATVKTVTPALCTSCN